MKNIFEKVKILNKRDYAIISLIAILLVLISSDFILELIFSNSSSTIVFVVIKAILLAVLLISIAYFINLKNIFIIKEAKNKLDDINTKHTKLLKKIKYDYFFYRHNPNEMFVEISDSIQIIFGYNKQELITSLKQHNITLLTDSVFEKVAPFVKESIIVPPFEVDIYAKNGDKLRFEIYESPVLNEQGDVVAIDAVAHNLHSHSASFLSEEKSTYKKIFEAANSAILIIKDNKFIDSNAKALEVYDCSIEEITMASPFSARFSPPFQPDGESSEEKASKYIEQAMIDGFIEFEWLHYKSNEKEFLAEISLTTFKYDSEKYLLVSVNESGGKISIDQTVIERNERLIGIFEYIEEAFVLINNNKEVLFCNNKLKSKFEVNKKQGYLNQIFGNGELCDAVNSFIAGSSEQELHNNILLNNIRFDVKLIRNNVHEIGVFLKPVIIDANFEANANELNEIIESSRALLYKLNVDTGAYVYISPSSKEVTGYTYKEFLEFNSKQLKELLHPNDLENADSIIVKLVRNVSDINKNSTLVYRFLHKSGEYRWFSDSYRVIEDESTGANYIIGNVHDITELIENKEALQKSEIRFRKTVENVQNGISIFENNKIIYVNDVLSEITGFTKAELLKLSSIAELAIEEERERVNLLIYKDEVDKIEFWIKTKDGNNICIQNRYSKSKISDSLTAKYVITTDVTEKKSLEIALSEKDDVFWSMTEKMNEIIVECNNNLDLIYVNKSGLDKLGRISVKNEKISVVEFVIFKDRKRVEKQLVDFVSGKYINYIEFTFLNNVSAKMYPNIVTNQETKAKGLRILIVNNINDLEITNELQLAKKSVDSVNKYNKVVIAEITKGLSKPIKSIKDIISLIEKTKLNQEQYNFLNIISKSSDSLKDLINDIDNLKLDENDDSLDQKFYLSEFLKDIEKEFVKTFDEKKIKLEVTKNFSKDFLLKSNKLEITKILLNILEVSLSQVDDGIIELEFIITKKDSSFVNVNFIIKNNGTVLSDLEVDRLNNSIKNSADLLNKEGDNYKLCNTIRLIKNQYGDIEFYKGRKGKNIFNFNLIIQICENQPELDSNGTADLKDINVLLVEDQPFNQMVIKTMMSNWDCTIEYASNGIHAIEKLKEQKYDIVLMDIYMPEMDGIEATNFIRKKLNNVNSKVPVIAITGHIYDSIDDYKKFGFDGFINKPVTSKELFTTMVNVLSKSDFYGAVGFSKPQATPKYSLKVVEQLSKGNKVLMNKMINIFISKYNEDIKELRTQIEKYNWERVYIISHGLKPSFNYMQVGKAEDYLFDILDYSKNRINTSEIKNRLELLEGELNPIINTLIEEVNRN